MSQTSVWFLTVKSSCRISDALHTPTPFFLFGDFNFRLDALSLVQVTLISCYVWVLKMHFCPVCCHRPFSLCFHKQHLSTSADVQRVTKDSSNEVEKIICEEKDNQVIRTTADTYLYFSSMLLFPAFALPAGAAPHWGEAVCLPAPGSFQGEQWQRSEYSIVTVMCTE